MALEPKQITSRIYQGGWIMPRHIPELQRLGITDLFNLDRPYENPGPFVEACITLHNVFIRDACLMTPQLMRDALAVIDDILSAPARIVYVHCNEGVSRSPTITWLYLIYRGASPEEATAKVKPNRLLYDAAMVQQLLANQPAAAAMMP